MRILFCYFLAKAMARFSDRTKRITRRLESDAFARYVMPVCWLLAFAGLVGMLVLAFESLVNASWDHGIFKACAGMTALPVIAILVRFVRGHFSSRIRES